MKNFITVFIFICLGLATLMVSTCDAEASTTEERGFGIIMPDGSFISLEGFDQTKVVPLDEPINISKPVKLTEWRDLITDTIRGVCSDLNVTVNEFIKTPVGLGAAALIIYKIGGDEIIIGVAKTIFNVVFIIPIWTVLMLILFYIYRKSFGCITIYKYKEVIPAGGKNGKDIINYSGPKRVANYAWKTEDAKVTTIAVLAITAIGLTIIMLGIIF